eukprot:1874464-Amphidinium_carterae.1
MSREELNCGSERPSTVHSGSTQRQYMSEQYNSRTKHKYDSHKSHSDQRLPGETRTQTTGRAMTMRHKANKAASCTTVFHTAPSDPSLATVKTSINR